MSNRMVTPSRPPPAVGSKTKIERAGGRREGMGEEGGDESAVELQRSGAQPGPEKGGSAADSGRNGSNGAPAERKARVKGAEAPPQSDRGTSTVSLVRIVCVLNTVHTISWLTDSEIS